jgi:hypothetical protein
MRSAVAMKNLAVWLVSREAAALESHDAPVQMIFGVCEKLCTVLSAMMGVDGCRSVMARALAMTHIEGHWLSAIRLKDDGTLELWSGELAVQEEVLWRGVALVAQLLGLMAAFVGEAYTLRLVRSVWPEAPVDSLELDADHGWEGVSEQSFIFPGGFNHPRAGW